MKTYPIMLVLEGAQTVVVGGGAVGVRKMRSLLAAGAKVRLVTRDLPDDDLGAVDVVQDDYEPGHLEGAKLVFACTDDESLNASIAADARKLGAIVNCVDQPADCDFFVPAMFSDGDVVVAIGTGGSAPALAAALKRNMAEAFPERIGEFAAALSQVKERIKSAVADPQRRSEVLKALAGESGYATFIHGGQAALIEAIEKLVS